MPIGFHASIAGGLHRAIERIDDLGCDALQMFIRNPRAWQYKPLGTEDVKLFKRERQASGIWPVCVHTSYLINLSSPDDGLFERSVALFILELTGAEDIGADYLVTHLGSHRGEGPEWAIKRIGRALMEVGKKGLGKRTKILVENSAGGGSTFGADLKEVGAVMEMGASMGLDMGFCFDTCHGFAHGYPMRTAAEATALVKTIEKEAGLDRLALIHLNDSKGGPGSGVDRHENIGKGRIGRAGLGAFLRTKKISALPIIMETPKKVKGDDVKNLKTVREIMGLKRRALPLKRP
ncbi:MAG: deoxyribonuclease IV [Thermodesulfobacteriota bacterium]|nr:MAG: deoxyribonuclease IV [Thermodesulfobacteriota bacterium]